MQTFILNTNLEISASQLDNKRLGKQLVEAMQIYKANFEDGPRQGNPYAYDMWIYNRNYLIEYGCIHYQEWMLRYINGSRGGHMQHKSGDEFCARRWMNEGIRQSVLLNPPLWLTEEFASNHRAIMLGKVWEKLLLFDNYSQQHRMAYEIVKWYRQFGWIELPAQRVDGRWPYLWPGKIDD
jgi:hypothetical protein